MAKRIETAADKKNRVRELVEYMNARFKDKTLSEESRKKYEYMEDALDLYMQGKMPWDSKIAEKEQMIFCDDHDRTKDLIKEDPGSYELLHEFGHVTKIKTKEFDTNDSVMDRARDLFVFVSGEIV